MAKKPIINPVSPGNNAAAINANLLRIQEAFDNTVSRDGSTPNHMEADLDMNSNDLLNVGILDAGEVWVRGVEVIPNEAVSEELKEYVELAQAAADDAEAAALAGQWFFDTKADAEAWSGTDALPESINTRGADSVDDGMGGFYVKDAVSSDTLIIAGQTYGRIKDIEPNRIGRARQETWLLTSDWQAIPENADEVAYQRAFMDRLAAAHPDIDYVCFPGDLVERASEGTTGDAPGYGYPELRADIESRLPGIPWDRWLFLPGNHDRDGSGAGLHRWSWTYETYRRHIGPEFYAVRKGNIEHIFLGDMAGSNSGEVFDFVLWWLRKTLEQAEGLNVILWMHQPLHGVHPSSLSENSAWSQIDGSSRIAPIIEDFADQIVFVGYGHVGRSIDTGTTVSSLYGVTWVNFSLAIPSLKNAGWSIPGVYSLMRISEGDEAITIQRWNAETNERFPELDTVLPVFKPLRLGGVGLDFDGRHQMDQRLPFVRGALTIYESAATGRIPDGSGGWTVPTEPTSLLNLILGDDSNDSMAVGAGGAIDWYTPGAAPRADDQTYQIVASPAYGRGASIAARRSGSTQTNYETSFSFGLRPSGAAEDDPLEEIAVIYPSTKGDVGAGLNIGSGGRLRVGGILTDLNFGASGPFVDGVVLRETGYVTASRDSFVGMWQRQASDGSLHVFRRGYTQVGSISVTETATAYNTSSDATLKEDEKPLTFEVARAILEMIAFYDFQWKSTGQRDLGVFAQELHDIYPSAVSVGGWFLEDGSPASAVEVGATYTPWAVDYSKLIPVVAACVQGTLVRQDALEARIEALEA